MLDVALLTFGVAGALLVGRRLPRAVPPLVAAAVALLLGRIGATDAFDAIRPLLAPLAFLVCSVPLAVLLDEAGCFDAAAALGGGLGALWVTAAVAVAILNLDAAVVLVTPLAVSVGRRAGARDLRPFVLVPPLVACLGSSALPVSNLTNLVVAHRVDATTGDFLRMLGPSTLVALIVGYGALRLAHRDATRAHAARHVERRPLLLGGAVVAALAVGFAIGVAPWAVALAVTAVVAAIRTRVPWRAIPWSTALLAAALGVLAAVAAPHLPIDGLIHGGDVRRVGAFALTANVVNNLPAVLLARPALHAHDGRVWSVLLGANAGPVILVTASLSNLLWLESVRRRDVAVGPRDYARAGILVGIPALAAAVAALVVVRAL